jgi:hypothetical protein
MKLKEIGYATRDPCGEWMTDLEFVRWLDRKPGSAYFSVLTDGSPMERFTATTVINPGLKFMLGQFERIKCHGGATDLQSNRLRLPGDLYYVDDEQRGIHDGFIYLTK